MKIEVTITKLSMTKLAYRLDMAYEEFRDKGKTNPGFMNIGMKPMQGTWFWTAATCRTSHSQLGNLGCSTVHSRAGA